MRWTLSLGEQEFGEPSPADPIWMHACWEEGTDTLEFQEMQGHRCHGGRSLQAFSAPVSSGAPDVGIPLPAGSGAPKFPR